MKIDIELFNQNLLITQQYCYLQARYAVKNVAHALRTIDRYNDIKLFSYKENLGFGSIGPFVSITWTLNPVFSDDSGLYDKLFDAQLSYKHDFLTDKLINNLDTKGRILVAEIEQTVFDGASEAVSYGLIDIYDCPPIDTWFYMTKIKGLRVLYAWIPEYFVELADEAIAVNCMDCLQWYHETGLS
ncbi:hypothetical protein AAFN85_21815 [Mucilaginibacter sp. CAU 1740]|uniref:hypothetical protein n=1 Tax=Mucilaginibacter sp. CAU 1740 TaxID=3140365 RepID=UPI00325BE3D5